MKDKLVALIARHGDTALNEKGLFRGWTDVPLSQNGLNQAHKASEFLKRFKISQIICSPLQRAVTTARILAQPHDLYVYQDRGLFPLSIGIFMGLNRDEQNAAFRLFVENPEVKIPDGESLEDFDSRQYEFWKQTIDRARNADALTLFVAHTSNVTALENFCEGNHEVEPECGETVKPGGVAALYYNASTKNYRLEPVFGKAEDAVFGGS